MIIQAIDNYLQERPRDERAKRCFHPSSLHLSEDELFWHYLEGDGDRQFESRVLRIFDNGHAVHRRLQAYLTDIGILKQAEVSVENDEYEIRGHADGIIEINRTTGVLEIKSINSSPFYSAFEPKEEHLIQVNVYMFCLGIPRACLLYECKDDQTLKEFYIKQDRAILEPILQKINFVQELLKSETNPRGRTHNSEVGEPISGQVGTTKNGVVLHRVS